MPPSPHRPSLRSPTQPTDEVPPEAPHVSKERSMETSIRHDDWATTGWEEISKRAQKSCLHLCISKPALGMNLEIKRERSTADRHSCDENALIANGLGPSPPGLSAATG